MFNVNPFLHFSAQSRICVEGHFFPQSGHCPHLISSHVDRLLLDAHFQYEHDAAVLRRTHISCDLKVEELA